jgi:two-component system sensor kinase FixL
MSSSPLPRDTVPPDRADRTARTGDARWRAIIESAVDGIITIDGHGLIQSFNPAAERLFGYRATEVIGQNVAILMPPPHAAEHDGYIRRYLETRQPRIIGLGREVTGRRKDATTFPIHLSVGEASIDGEITFVGIVRNLSERVALEARLREESGLARIGEFAAVLAHEVRNPLAAVSGAIQMIAKRLPAGSEEHDVSREVLQRLDALNALMGDLLLYARPPQPTLRPVDLDDLLASLIAFLRSDPAWRELTVIVDGSAGIVDADPEMIKIALQNLLLNAVQAMRGRGVLRVVVLVDDGVTHIDIIDSGGGIPEEARARIFTPFFTTKTGGTGLGLATVKRIAESHGGQITLVSSSSSGTTMRLSLLSRATGGTPWLGS